MFLVFNCLLSFGVIKLVKHTYILILFFYSHTKNVEINFYFVDKVARYNSHQVSSKDQIADVLTKLLSIVRFQFLQDKLKVKYPLLFCEEGIGPNLFIKNIASLYCPSKLFSLFSYIFGVSYFSITATNYLWFMGTTDLILG